MGINGSCSNVVPTLSLLISHNLDCFGSFRSFMLSSRGSCLPRLYWSSPTLSGSNQEKYFVPIWKIQMNLMLIVSGVANIFCFYMVSNRNILLHIQRVNRFKSHWGDKWALITWRGWEWLRSFRITDIFKLFFSNFWIFT